MANENEPNGANGAAQPEPRQTLRDIAEQAWDDIDAAGDAGDPTGEGQQEQVDDGSQPRDAQGRFQARQPAQEPGEAAAQRPPSPDQNLAPQTPPHPAPDQGRSSEAPANWSAQDRQTFAALPKEGQEFLLRRHSEMEGDYQRRVQATATAAQFTSALAPIFQDPVIAGSLQQANASPYDAIQQWASFHRRAMDPNIEVRQQLWQELGQRMGLNPAAGGMSQPGALSEQDLKDPVIRHFADITGRALNDVQTLRGELHQMRQQDAERQSAEVMRVSQWQVDQFAAEKDAQGNLLHPHFDAVLPQVIELFRANPQRDLKEAYEMAIWMVPTIRSGLLTAQQTAQQQQASAQRARQAARSNARGITSPVAKPAPGDQQAKGVRAALEAAADEIGM